ncbi:hypothetical protein C8R43DRAFT_1131233 [Mycena crocata]|nr:hypothetical protein C8R43DRAFT_1131233 [Mycena crocata]
MSSAPPPASGPLSGSVIYGLEGELITTAVQFWLHGLYSTLAGIAVYNLLHKEGLPARRGLIVATFLMFAFANLQVIEQLAFNVLKLTSLGAHPPDNTTKLLNIRLSLNVFGRANYLMSDAIVVWRAWVLYHDNIRVRLLLTLCLVGSLVGATTDMAFGTLWLYGNLKFTPTGPRALILVLPLLATNIIATSLMGYKVWQYRQQIKAQLNLPKNKSTKVERILVILTESGTIYCLIWVPFLYSILTEQDTETTAYKIIANIVPQLSAIYPIVIVLLVSIERTHLELTVTGGGVSRPIHFVSGPGGGATGATSLGADQSHALDSTEDDTDFTGTRRDTDAQYPVTPRAKNSGGDSSSDLEKDLATKKEPGVESMPLRIHL